MLHRGSLLVSLLALGQGAAMAQDHAIGLKAGFFGLGVEYTYDVSERLSVRGGLNGSQYGFDAEESGIEYDFDVIWDSFSLALDFHPRRSPLRLTLGLLGNDNGLEARSRLTGNVEIGGTTHTPGEVGSLRVRVAFDDTAPFAGIGWDWSRKHERFGVSFDLGVLSQGSPVVALDSDGGLVGDPSFAADLAAEEAELTESLADLDVVPYAILGFVFRF